MTIEDIILSEDKRGISTLRQHLPEDFCDRAASLVLGNPGTAIIATGFYIMRAGATETDGPPGAIAIGDALQSIGYQVVYVTDRYTTPVISAVASPDARVVDFPITDDEASKALADGLLAELGSSVLIAIERCGLTDEGLYRTMHGQDMSEYNARLDHIFLGHPITVGIGDGGNEIGMGNLASEITKVPTLVKKPCVTRTTGLIISSVSNWGGYGLVAALSRQKGKNLLPSIGADQDTVKRCVDAGAVDGNSTRQVYRVDGFTLEENSRVLSDLHELLAREGIAS